MGDAKPDPTAPAAYASLTPELLLRVTLVSGTALAAGFSTPVASAIPLTNPNSQL